VVQAVRVENDADRERFAGMAVATEPVTAAGLADEHADEDWMVPGADGSPAARVSLWWRRVPALEGHRIGLVGHYAARSDDAAAVLLDAACRRLRENGCTLAVGPMDGSTWRRYRFVIERGSEPPFFLDIDQPDAWPRQFARTGFRELARYCSSLNPDLARRHPLEEEWEARVRARGISLRPIDVNRLDAEMKSIFRVSAAAFANNYLYTPIDEETFLRMYRPVIQQIRPELVLLAERAGETVGFVFCIPDLLEARRTSRAATVVLKTIAVHPQAMNLGLGSHLVASAQRAAFELGYQRLIIAFMHEDNPSLRISAHYAHVIRRYALYGRELGA
jgi:GNAT superfamily N-acetyltransferase